jgi:hypothetical protein
MDDPVKILLDMKDETVSAKYIAPIAGKSVSVIVYMAKHGLWDHDKDGNFLISGKGKNAHVLFFRKDFLRKHGFLDPDPEKPTAEQLLMRMIEVQMDTNMLLAQLLNKNTAGAATPTE